MLMSNWLSALFAGKMLALHPQHWHEQGHGWGKLKLRAVPAYSPQLNAGANTHRYPRQMAYRHHWRPRQRLS